MRSLKEQFEIRVYKILIILYMDDILLIKFFNNKKFINFDFTYKLSYFFMGNYKNKGLR